MDFNINTLVHTKMMKYSALLALDGNNGHFVNELDRTTSEGREIVKVDIIIILDMIIPSFPVDTRLSRTRITSFCRYIMTSACLFTVRVGQRQPSSLVVYSGSWPRRATCWMFRSFFCGPDAPPLLEVLVAGTRNNVQRYSGEVASVRARCASERRAPMVQVQRNTERRPKNRAKKSSGTRVIWLRVGSRCRLVFLPFVLAFACLLSRPVPGFRAAVPVGASAVLGRRLVLTGIP